MSRSTELLDSAPASPVGLTLGDPRIEMLEPSQLKPYAKNARTHSGKQLRQIANSIRQFGFTNPILIDERNMILAGHGRVEAAKQLDIKRVPCIRLGSMTSAEKRAYVLADNKLAENAGWDIDILSDELRLILGESEIDIALTGFSVPEVELLLETGESGPAPSKEGEDAVPQRHAVDFQ